MGGLLSHEEEKGGTTPLRPSSSSPPHWRQLEEDPRSPSVGIDRTPILVDRTEESTINPLDPRSPTVGITRTPLFLGTHAQQQRSGAIPSSEEICQPPVPDAEMRNLTIEDEKPVEDACKDEDAEEDKADVPDLHGLSVSDSDESATLLPVEQQAGWKPLGWRTSSQTQAALKSTMQPKQLFQSGGQPPVIPPQPRPAEKLRPLSLKSVDTNSPRVLVQRKAIRKVEASRQTHPDSLHLTVDKENWSH